MPKAPRSTARSASRAAHAPDDLSVRSVLITILFAVAGIGWLAGCAIDPEAPSSEQRSLPDALVGQWADASAAGDARDAPDARDALGIPTDGADGAAGDLDVADIPRADADVVRDAADVDLAPSDTGAELIPSVPASCLDLKTKQPDTATGYHDIDPDLAGTRRPIRVYCQMDVANGGWTLVARSDGQGSTDWASGGFGWGYATGAADDFGQPYALNVREAGLGFSEILVAARSGANVVAAYRLVVGDDFLQRCVNSGCPILDGPHYEAGPCTSLAAGQPQMLTHAGYTSTNDRFVFRDNPDMGNFGLDERGFHVAGYYDCERGGDLQDWGGMLFVR